MTPEQVMELAKQAGVSVRGYYDETGSTPTELQRFAELVRSAVLDAPAVEPRKAVKLTDDEISDIAIDNPPNVHIYARAIEQAVWAKLGVSE